MRLRYSSGRGICEGTYQILQLYLLARTHTYVTMYMTIVIEDGVHYLNLIPGLSSVTYRSFVNLHAKIFIFSAHTNQEGVVMSAVSSPRNILYHSKFNYIKVEKEQKMLPSKMAKDGARTC